MIERLQMTTPVGNDKLISLENAFLKQFREIQQHWTKRIQSKHICLENIASTNAQRILIASLIRHFAPHCFDLLNPILQFNWDDFADMKSDVEKSIKELMVQFPNTRRESLYSDCIPAIDPSILGRIYEEGIAGDQREKKGVFFTSRVEIELMCKISLFQYLKSNIQGITAKISALIFTLQDSANSEPTLVSEMLAIEDVALINDLLCKMAIVDPSCGSGAFLLGMVNVIQELTSRLARNCGDIIKQKHRITEIIAQNIYGVEIDPEALEITKARLLIAAISYMEDEPPQGVEDLHQTLVRHVSSQDWLVSDPEMGPSQFSLVIGNPPYVQHTRIAPPEITRPTKQQKSAYVRQIQEKAYADWNRSIDLRGQADYLVYFFLRGLKILRPGGILCYITSSTWLDGELGLELKKFLLEHVSIVQIMDTLAGKSFTQANINTVITVLKNAPPPTQSITPPVQFILFKEPYARIIAEGLFSQVEALNDSGDYSWGQVTTMPQSVLALGKSLDSSSKLENLQNRWGMQFLKYYGPIAKIFASPAVMQKMVALSRLAQIKRGFTSGANEFFYISAEEKERWQIEDCFLIPLLKSPKPLECIAIEETRKAKHFVFFCREGKANLQGTNALRYIEEFGEHAQVSIKGRAITGFQNTETCLARDPWYALPSHTSAPIIIQKGFYESFAAFHNAAGLLVDQTFYEIIPKQPNLLQPLLAVLNSTLGIFELLRISTSGLGGGLYRPTVNEIRTLQLPDIINLPINELPEAMRRRKIGTIFEECGLNPHKSFQIQVPNPHPDRRQLDEQIFEFLGISREWLPELYRATCGLVRDRMQKADRISSILQ